MEEAKLLIIDDDQFNLEAMKQMLRQIRVQSDTALDGKTGIAKVMAKIVISKQQKRNLNYTHIFVDYRMPDLLGTDVARGISKLYSQLKLEIPIMYCLTAEEISPELEEIAKEAGMLGVLTKPMQLVTL